MFGGAELSPETVGTLPQENKIFDRAANWTQAVLLRILSLRCPSRPVQLMNTVKPNSGSNMTITIRCLLYRVEVKEVNFSFVEYE